MRVRAFVLPFKLCYALLAGDVQPQSAVPSAAPGTAGSEAMAGRDADEQVTEHQTGFEEALVDEAVAEEAHGESAVDDADAVGVTATIGERHSP